MQNYGLAYQQYILCEGWNSPFENGSNCRYVFWITGSQIRTKTWDAMIVYQSVLYLELMIISLTNSHGPFINFCNVDPRN